MQVGGRAVNTYEIQRQRPNRLLRFDIITYDHTLRLSYMKYEIILFGLSLALCSCRY